MRLHLTKRGAGENRLNRQVQWPRPFRQVKRGVRCPIAMNPEHDVKKG